MGRYIDPFPQYITTMAGTLAGGSVEIRNSSTGNLVDLFSSNDQNENTAIANPVLLGDDGQVPDIYFIDGLIINVLVKDSAGNIKRSGEDIPTSGGLSGVLIFNSEETYQVAERALFESIWYTSNKPFNKGNIPNATPQWWTREPVTGAYNANVNYIENDLANENGIEYRSKLGSVEDPNIGNTPSESSDLWANTSGIGVQTLNLNCDGFIVPATGGATVERIPVAVNGIIISGMSYSNVTVTDSQFNIVLPASWDDTSQIIGHFVWGRSISGTGTQAVINIAGLAFNDGDPATTTFGTGVTLTITGTNHATFYYSAPFTIPITNNPQAGDTIYFRVRRVVTDENDNIDTAVLLESLILQYTSLSSTDA